MSEQRKMFYCTRGWENGHQGTCHPILALTEDAARQYMYDNFGHNWCTSYTAGQWAEAHVRAEKYGYMLEPEEPTVIV